MSYRTISFCQQMYSINERICTLQHVNMSHHQYCTIIRDQLCFKNEFDTVITFLHHCSAFNTVWAYVSKEDMMFIALVKLHTSGIYLHSLQ